jgi:sugar lactone lactonase YvrE
LFIIKQQEDNRVSSQSGRYRGPAQARVAEGWRLERITPPSRLFGANGLRTGADGRIYVAQVPGSQVSAVDIDSGEIEVISPMGGAIVAPDDLAFDASGNLYATEITEGRVSVLSPSGDYRVIQGDMPCANPITMHRGRLYAGECRPGGRILELDLDGGAPRVILEDVPMPNAFEVGPDGLLYFPVMGANEIWRVDPAGGAAEVVARNLGVPDSVKFDAQGFIVSTQVASGQVLRIDPATGEQTVLATVAPGLDNCTFVGNRLFVSSISGQVNEVLPSGELRPLVPNGLQWPMGLALDAAGKLFIADGGFTYQLSPGGEPEMLGMLFTPGFPGFTRGVASRGPGEWLVTTANGDVAVFRPASQASEVLAGGYDRLMGVAPGAGGSAVFAEYGSGRLLVAASGEVRELATGLDRPTGVAVATDGACYVAESGAGRIVKVASGGGRDTVLDDLGEPHGLALADGKLYVVDVGSKTLLGLDVDSGSVEILARDLPVGAPPGVVAPTLNAIGELSGPMISFAGIAVGGEGGIYLAGDGEGSVLLLQPD